jgi:hypothetical protein
MEIVGRNDDMIASHLIDDRTGDMFVRLDGYDTSFEILASLQSLPLTNI